MGNKPSWPERTACVTVPATTNTLSECDAFDIAILWHAELSGYGRLDTTSHLMIQDRQIVADIAIHQSTEDFTVVERLKWIEFDFARTFQLIGNLGYVAARRGSSARFHDFHDDVRQRQSLGSHCRVVLALAFTRTQFLETCISVLMQSSPKSTTGVLHGTIDSERFFDDPSRSFPSVHFHWFANLPLELMWENPRHGKHNRTLGRVLHKLQPFICASQWQREIAMAVRIEHDETTFVTRLPQLNLKNVESPGFKLTSILAGWFSVKTIAQHTNARLFVTKNEAAWTGNLIDEGMASLIAQQHGEPEPAHHAHIATLDLLGSMGRPSSQDTDALFASWCSALPHTRTVTSFHVVDRSASPDTFEQRGKWLGYTIFHPDAGKPDASIENLSLLLTESHQSVEDGLRMMSVGNNIDSHKPTQGYQQGRIRRGTHLWLNDFLGADEDAVLYTCDAECWITFTFISSSFSQRVKVVLPGYGFAWVESEDSRGQDTVSSAIMCQTPSISSPLSLLQHHRYDTGCAVAPGRPSDISPYPFV